jgi:hypothetical protein
MHELVGFWPIDGRPLPRPINQRLAWWSLAGPVGGLSGLSLGSQVIASRSADSNELLPSALLSLAADPVTYQTTCHNGDG